MAIVWLHTQTKNDQTKSKLQFELINNLFRMTFVDKVSIYWNGMKNQRIARVLIARLIECAKKKKTAEMYNKTKQKFQQFHWFSIRFHFQTHQLFTVCCCEPCVSIWWVARISLNRLLFYMISNCKGQGEAQEWRWKQQERNWRNDFRIENNNK